MLINADFSQRAIVKPDNYCWVKSPGGEVERVMLDRTGDEKARVTSLVRYAPGSVFPEHAHPSGEEILVLSGVFTENLNQHYPAGWYLRNPHGSRHLPSSSQGALIFVKLMQMAQNDSQSIRINTKNPSHWQHSRQRFICPLFQSEHEKTYLEMLHPDQHFAELSSEGIEILVTKGQLCDDGTIYDAGSWIRLPPKTRADFQAGKSGATLYVKTGHLIQAVASMPANI